MSAKPPSLPSPRRRRIRPGYIVLGIALAPFLFLLAWHVSFRIRTQSEIKQLEAKARANGEPWTLAEVAATYYGPIPDEENAAIPLMALWEKDDPEFWGAIKRHQKPIRERVSDPLLKTLPNIGELIAGRNPSDADRSLTSAFLRKKQQRIESIFSALERGRARFPVDLTQGYSSATAHIAMLKEEADLLARHSLQQLTEGSAEAAVHAVVQLVRIGELLGEDPRGIAQLNRFAIHGLACGLVRQLLDRDRLEAVHLESVSAALSRLEDPGASQRALAMQRGMDRAVFRNDRDVATCFSIGFWEQDPGWYSVLRDHAWGVGVLRWSGALAHDEAFYLRTVDHLMANARALRPDGLKANERLSAKYYSDAQTISPSGLTRVLLPGSEAVLVRQALWEALHRITRLALAIERHRVSPGSRLPERLSDLVPAFIQTVPIDPFDGQPLRYRVGEKGYVVYSVGKDGRDDGGKERSLPDRSDAPDTAPYDEVFSVSR